MGPYMQIPLEQAAFNLIVAIICGALIGSERQIRQRMAGLRTNSLVALGAAGFVVFSGLFPTELSPTRVGAQVVSGIGFLGAGIIFRHGFTVHGLNTAATLWCSAAVGLLAGASAPIFAMLMTACVIFVNLGLRPLVKWIKKRSNSGAETSSDFQIMVTCRPEDEGIVRELLIDLMQLNDTKINELKSGEPAKRNSDVETTEFTLICDVPDSADISNMLTPLLRNPKILGLNWIGDQVA
jgi:putative Mg2+ transporter-C (MgtC) family protein